jgi:8-oxo-dGTP diphosphatase
MTGQEVQTPDDATASHEPAVRRQRVGAYAVVVVDRCVLLTRLGPGTPFPGRWALPGGGLEHGERPLDAVRREVHEETSHRLRDVRLFDVGSRHFVGRSPKGRLEDFHHLEVVYTAGVEAVAEPVVLDVGGTTDRAAWWPVQDLAGLRLGGGTADWLAAVLGPDDLR